MPLTRPILLSVALAVPAAAQIPGIGPKGLLQRMGTGFAFTEGPAQDAAGNLYFSDIPNSRIHKVDRLGNRSTFWAMSDRSNGIFFDRRDRMLVCQGGAGRVLELDKKTTAVTVLAAQFNTKRFNSPNDLVPDAFGGIWFTDPVFGSRTPHQPVHGVYYIAASGKVTLVVANLTRPNGIALSPREDVLYVAAQQPAAVMAYDVLGPGRLGPPRSLYPVGSAPVDGMTVDTEGRLYLTRPALGAIQVITPNGKSLGRISVPEGPANCAFGGPRMQTLYITARTSVYRGDMLSTGHRQIRLRASADTLSVRGGRVDLGLDADAFHKGRFYAFLGTASGTEPGFAFARTRIPINVDPLTITVLSNVNRPPFVRFSGQLDASGDATAQLVVPALGAALIGRRLHFAGVLLAPTDGSSNAAGVTFVR